MSSSSSSSTSSSPSSFHSLYKTEKAIRTLYYESIHNGICPHIHCVSSCTKFPKSPRAIRTHAENLLIHSCIIDGTCYFTSCISILPTTNKRTHGPSDSLPLTYQSGTQIKKLRISMKTDKNRLSSSSNYSNIEVEVARMLATGNIEESLSMSDDRDGDDEAFQFDSVPEDKEVDQQQEETISIPDVSLSFDSSTASSTTFHSDFVRSMLLFFLESYVSVDVIVSLRQILSTLSHPLSLCPIIQSMEDIQRHITSIEGDKALFFPHSLSSLSLELTNIIHYSSLGIDFVEEKDRNDILLPLLIVPFLLSSLCESLCYPFPCIVSLEENPSSSSSSSFSSSCSLSLFPQVLVLAHQNSSTTCAMVPMKTCVFVPSFVPFFVLNHRMIPIRITPFMTSHQCSSMIKDFDTSKQQWKLFSLSSISIYIKLIQFCLRSSTQLHRTDIK